MPSLKFDTIDRKTFNAILSRYPALVPEKLEDLDTLRYDMIPSALAERRATQSRGDQGSLTKLEVEILVRWKLKHGTFRPALMALVKSNSVDVIEETTRHAFEISPSLPDTAMTAMSMLTHLKGIGPATASLLLSVSSPESVPFFSDELFRWTSWDDADSTGWGRTIRYNTKEYGRMFGRVELLSRRLGLRAVDMEKVAWVLGKEGADIDAHEEAHENYLRTGATNEPPGAEELEMDEEIQTEDVGSSSKKGTKRNATDTKKEGEGTRKSTRTTR